MHTHPAVPLPIYDVMPTNGSNSRQLFLILPKAHLGNDLKEQKQTI